jgi:hypothetical protein
MAARRQSTLLAQGKERRLDGTGWPWRVRLYAPPPSGTSYQSSSATSQVQGRCRRGRAVEAGAAASQHRGRGPQDGFAQAEEALDHEQAAPATAKVRATRTIEALAAE